MGTAALQPQRTTLPGWYNPPLHADEGLRRLVSFSPFVRTCLVPPPRRPSRVSGNLLRCVPFPLRFIVCKVGVHGWGECQNAKSDYVQGCHNQPAGFAKIGHREHIPRMK